MSITLVRNGSTDVVGSRSTVRSIILAFCVDKQYSSSDASSVCSACTSTACNESAVGCAPRRSAVDEEEEEEEDEEDDDDADAAAA